MAMTASDRGYSVTLVFAADGISILDGGDEPLDAAIVGPYETLVDLIQGEDSPIKAHLGRRIKVTSRPRKLFFPLHVHNLMKLDKEGHSDSIESVRRSPRGGPHWRRAGDCRRAG